MTTSGNQSNKVAARKSQLQLVLGNFNLPVAALPSLRKSSNKAMIFFVCLFCFVHQTVQAGSSTSWRASGTCSNPMLSGTLLISRLGTT